jgi:hypothetical protein
MAAAALYGALRARKMRRRFLIIWLIATFGFGVLAYTGSAIQLFDNLEPARFEVAFFSFAVPFAALGARVRRVTMGRDECPWSDRSGAAAAGAGTPGMDDSVRARFENRVGIRMVH